MTRFVWIQGRTQFVVALLGVAVIAAVAAVTGPHIDHLYHLDVANCRGHGDCPTAVTAFLDHDRLIQIGLNTLVLLVPALIGIFWGAPLVARELELGSYRLVWTQSVTRTRWLVVKLAVVGVLGMAVTGLLSLTAVWWSSPFDRVNMNRFTNALFGERGITPVGYAALAFVLGVTLGIVIRRTLPAMATTLVAFLACRVAIAFWIRPKLIAPLHMTSGLTTASVGFGSANGGPFTLVANQPTIPNAWIYSSQIVDGSGRLLTENTLATTCPHLGTAVGPPPGRGQSAGEVPTSIQDALQHCLTRVGATYHEVVTYQPGSRYWALQGYETAICIALAVLLAGGCIWWVRNRLR